MPRKALIQLNVLIFKTVVRNKAEIRYHTPGEKQISWTSH